MRQVIDDTLHDENIARRSDAAPVTASQPLRRLVAAVIDEHIGNVVRPAGAIDDVQVDAVLLIDGQEARHDVRPDDAMSPAHWPTRSIEAYGDAAVIVISVVVV